jgi:hypothetical protein
VPIVATKEESSEAYLYRLLEILSGHDPYVVLGIRNNPTPQDVERMHAIYSVFRACIVGRHVGRDWKILFLAGAGFAFREIASRVLIEGERRITRQAAQERKEVQCQAIAHKLAHLMPVPAAA